MFNKPLITNPFNLKMIGTEDLRRLVSFMKLFESTKDLSRENLIQVLADEGIIKLKFKLGWQ